MILRACPFCGDKKELINDSYHPTVAGRPRLWVCCEACRATGPEKDDLHEAEYAWNDRALDA